MSAVLSPVDTEAASNANEFLTFTLGKEEYGIDIFRVQEIRGYAPLPTLPTPPPSSRA